MKRNLILFLFISLFSTILYSKDTIYLASGEWPPYLSEKLPKQGFASHLIKEIFEAVDVDVQYEFYPWKRTYRYSKEAKGSSKKWNGTLMWIHTPERAKHFLYSDVVITDVDVLYTLKEKKINWNTIEDLKGKVIGGTLHTAYPDFEEAQNKGILYLKRAGGYKVLLQRLLRNRIDAVPIVKSVGDYYVRTSLNAEEKEKITSSATVINTYKYHLILNKKLEENKRFMKLFNKGLKIIKENGRYEELYESFKLGNYD